MAASSLPLFSWLRERSAGLLLHPTSLPSAYGIGSIGSPARAFIDFLAESGLRYWQLLPLGPTGYGNSPYSAYSVFAGNPLLIDMHELLTASLLSMDELAPLTELPDNRVAYDALKAIHAPLMRLATRRFHERGQAYLGDYGRLADFRKQHAVWLEPYALFMALKRMHGGSAWTDWATPWRDYTTALNTELPPEVADEVEVQIFEQYIFWGQWSALRDYATSRKIEFIGDLPIYAAGDSADTWSCPEIFELDETGRGKEVAGVPPDYFAETGQLWGNPVYNWHALAKDNYEWWMRRLEQNFALCDVIRLDHFRAFYDYWAIPGDAEDARGGVWKNGPQLKFFETLRARFGADVKIIAEDLGDLHDGVRDFLAELGLPGMSILHFAFDGNDGKNAFLPHNSVPNNVVYPGTHDNDTTVGWYAGASPEIQDQVRRYLRISGDDIAWDFIRAGYRTSSRLCVITMQDLLQLGTEARMNMPGKADGNWEWRMTPAQFDSQRGSAPYLQELAWLYGR
jgi:4-alpha-glucanotransferase